MMFRSRPPIPDRSRPSFLFPPSIISYIYSKVSGSRLECLASRSACPLPDGFLSPCLASCSHAIPTFTQFLPSCISIQEQLLRVHFIPDFSFSHYSNTANHGCHCDGDVCNFGRNSREEILLDCWTLQIDCSRMIRSISRDLYNSGSAGVVVLFNQSCTLLGQCNKSHST